MTAADTTTVTNAQSIAAARDVVQAAACSYSLWTHGCRRGRFAHRRTASCRSASAAENSCRYHRVRPG